MPGFMSSFAPKPALPTLVAGLFLALALGTAAPAQAATDPAEVERLCKEADARYAQMFPDAKPVPGVAVVKLYNFTFCPNVLTVKAGTTVKFVNVDKRTSHSVWFREAGKPESDRFFGEESWEMRFDQPGEFPYICGPHENEKMTGRVKVVP